MDNDEKYKLIFNTMLNGTVEDWENLSTQFSDFPDGLTGDEEYKDNSGRTQYHGQHWITEAIDCCSFECVRWMISKCVNLRFVDCEGYLPLHSCIDREFPDKHEMLQLLIDNGADVNIGTELGTMGTNSWLPLHMAVARNDLQAIKILLNNGLIYLFP